MSGKRDKNGRFIKGSSGNPRGGKYNAVIKEFRENPNVKKVLSKIFKIALSLGTKKEHPDAFQAAKTVADKCIPTVKAQDIQIESTDFKSFVVLPKQEIAKIDGE